MTQHLLKLQEKLGIIGKSQAIYDLLEIVDTAAPTNISVLINGESGTGKEVIANSIHKLSERKHKPFVAINCGALPENLIDSELFGYEKGAFTGAVAQKKGLFEVADTGTIFLDELGEMPLKTQVRLLRVLESGEIVRVGGTESIRVDVRVIAATNKNLLDSIEKNEFRRDLYYRLKAITIFLPALKDRREDIKLLLDHFIKQYILHNHVIFGGIEEEATQILLNHSWPGNIRELKNMIETLLVLAKGQKITAHMVMNQMPEEFIFHHENQSQANLNLPMSINKSSEQVEREIIYQTLLSMKMDITELKNMMYKAFGNFNSNQLPAYVPPQNDFNSYANEHTNFQSVDESDDNLSMLDMEKEMIKKALEKFTGNRRKAAQALNISERTLYRKIKEYDI